MIRPSEAVTMRSFATFNGNDDVQLLADQTLTRLAGKFRVDITDCYDDPSQLTALATEIDELTDDGTRPAEYLSVEDAVSYVKSSGLLELQPRGIMAMSEAPDVGVAWVIDTSHANWLEGAFHSRIPIRKKLVIPPTIFVPGRRLMDRHDEALNENVRNFTTIHQRPPTEEEFYNWYFRQRVHERGVDELVDVVMPDDIGEAGLDLDVVDEENRQELGQYAALFAGREDLRDMDADFMAYGVGAASLTLACKLHIGGRIAWGGYFNELPERPSVVAVPATLPLAETEDKLVDSSRLSPYTALSSLATAAHWLVRLQTGKW